MRQIQISDVTIRNAAKQTTFREKLELAKLLDRLGVSVIELRELENVRTDSLLVKSIAAVVKESILALPVGLTEEGVREAWEAVSCATKPRLIVSAAVSTVQMEYLFRKKPDGMLETIASVVSLCKSLCADVEFQALDATRADAAFLGKAIETAAMAGAGTVTLCDSAGNMLPEEFSAFVARVRSNSPCLSGVKLGVSCADTLTLAGACSISAVGAGADQITAAAYGSGSAPIAAVVRMLQAKGEYLDCTCTLRTTQLERLVEQIVRLCETSRSKSSPFDNGVQEQETELALGAEAGPTQVAEAAAKLGYDLSEEDRARVYEAFCRIAARKEEVGARELDVIVASAALQVPATYRVESYVINTGNIITATAHVKLLKKDLPVEGVSVGDGPIDAAFLAIEQIVGHHFELDDFQIQAVTEGREAMGQTVVKLRSAGKVYSGMGISTDIIGASIRAYVSALNKIVYEEAEA